MNLPEEQSNSAAKQTIRLIERRVVSVLIWCSPVLFVAGWFGASLYWRTLLYLQPPNQWDTVLTSRIGVLIGTVFASAPFLWKAALKFSRLDANRFRGFLSVSIVLVILILAGVVLDHPKARFALEEAVKARAPQLDFVRNIAFKQQLLRNSPVPHHDGRPHILIVGSSQINLGIDTEMLRQSSGAADIQSLCMPGMVPLQYSVLAKPLCQQKPTHVLCWVSEFDFFRETSVPVVRLRWCSNADNLARLASTLTSRQQFDNRSELADLALASLSPIWQQRSLINLVAFRFWWPWNVGVSEVDEDEAKVGAALVGQQRGLENARRNISRTAMVRANFQSFGEFAKVITGNHIRLIVIEGESHPETMKAYPAEFRLETRARIKQLADTIGFEYFDETLRPVFVESDWRDAVHLNEQGRDRLTRFVAGIIDTEFASGQKPEPAQPEPAQPEPAQPERP
ncbi:hypothetical protein NZK35_22470 [Stieleria sp. ICT_E10.1]|uniref:hypothetical protein n=1 Tax=Stieleria sedimenti TaxID=2976331 RepID=UPI0021802B5A|nr:hypothetical protein [Stieleria sedimenti]MCS7469427.1 hypothetical protein [Stieleria sedimenti]